MFVENGHDKSKLETIAKNYIQKRDTNQSIHIFRVNKNVTINTGHCK